MIRVYISQGDPLNGLSFYVVDQNEFDGKRYLLQFGKYNVTREEVEEGAQTHAPTFHLNTDAALQFIKSIAERASERGIKLDSDLKREGKLEAVQLHLEDMRKLVFQVKP